MKTIPIIFQNFSINSIIKGIKTETRRVTKSLEEINKNPDEWIVSCHGIYTGSNHFIQFAKKDNLSERVEIKSPYGYNGDELWVREGWGQISLPKTSQKGFVYKYSWNGKREGEIKWKSPLFMPREASRITLINEGVTIERLHDISEDGAIREGVITIGNISHDIQPLHKMISDLIPNNYGLASEAHEELNKFTKQLHREIFKNIWIEMHGEESWNLNPYVWVLKFSVKEIKA